MSHNFIKEHQAKVLKATHNNAQSYTSSGNRTLLWNAASINTCSTYSAGLFTATVAGRFLITASIFRNPSTNVIIHIAKNGTIVFTTLQYGSLNNPTISGLIQLAVGDTFSIQMYPVATVSGYDGKISAVVIP